MPLYFLQDNGQTVFRDGDQTVYQKVGTRNDVQPNASWTSNDVLNVQGYTFTNADSQGKTIYTSEEMAVAENLYSTYLLNDVGTYVDLWALAPVSGVLRFSCDYYRGTVRINGATIVSPIGGHAGDWRGAGGVINVAAGDQVEFFGGDSNIHECWAGIIPFVYP